MEFDRIQLLPDGWKPVPVFEHYNNIANIYIMTGRSDLYEKYSSEQNRYKQEGNRLLTLHIKNGGFICY